jgi:protein-tyrosine phosphatase
MIDTHCHLLPGLDDGSRSLSESVSMARRLTGYGVSAVVCTPHVSPQFPTRRDRAVQSLQALESALSELRIQLELKLAAEVHPTSALQLDADALRMWALNGRYLVVELLGASRSDDIESIFRRVTEAGLTPIFAHPERCEEIQSGSSVLDGLRVDGAVVQVVAPSLTGSAPSSVARTAWDLISRGAADVVASDGHRAEGARLRLDALADVIATRAGREVAEELLTRQPRVLVTSANRSDATVG